MKKRLLAVAMACVMLAAGALGCSAGSPAAASGDAMKIGGLAPLTGEVSVYGIACNNGIQIAIKEINDKGGVLGKQIDYVVYDEKGDATEAVNAYNKLVQNDKIVALLGDVTSTPTIAVAQQAVKDGIPMITATGTAEDITKAGENVFRACFIDPFQGEIMASYAATQLSAKTAAIIYNTADDYSLGLTEAFQAKAKELGLEVLVTEGYTGGDVDFKSQLTNIASANPDVLFIPVYYEDVALIATQAKEVGITATLLGADGWDGVLDKIDASNTAVVEGALFCNHYSSESDNADLQNFIKAYTEAYGEAPNAFSALGYDAAKLLFAAMEKAGTTESKAVVEAMKNIEYAGITGNITYDENRNPIKSAAITTITSGAYKFVEYYDM